MNDKICQIIQLQQQFQCMRNNKQQSKSNYDYLNFIRRNQQIVKEFKQISQLDKKAQQLKKLFSSSSNPQRTTIQPDRYQDPPPLFQDILFNYRHKTKQQIGSGKDIPQGSLQLAIRHRKERNQIQKNGKAEFYTRNLSIPGKAEINKSELKQGLNQIGSQVKFPKLTSRLSRQNDQQGHSRSNSQCSLSKQKQIMTPQSKRAQKQKKKQENWKKNYVPLSLQVQKPKDHMVECKVKSLKLDELSSNKINNKLIRTYYDYENLLELKQRVSQLVPTFKPIQTKKKDRVHILHLQKQGQYNDLQQYLQANNIKQLSKKALRNANANMNQQQMMVAGKHTHIGVVGQIDKEIHKNYQTCSPVISGNPEEKGNDIFEDEIQKQKQTQQRTNRTSVSPNKLKKNKKQVKYPQQNLNAQEQTVYQNKIASYRQFLFMVNFAHRIFDPLILNDDPEKHKAQNKFKYYLGPGNNSLLIKSLMKRRFWWVQVDDPKQANFVWTQLKVNNFYQFQKKTTLIEKYDKLDCDHSYSPVKQKKLAKSKAKLDTNKKPEQNKVGGILRGQLPQNEKKIFTNADSLYLANMMEQALEQNPKLKNFSKFQTRLKYLPQQFLKKKEQDYFQNHVHNHLCYNYEIGNKKALFYNLKHYYEILGINPFNSIPLTFHIKKGVSDPQYTKFLKEYKKLKNQLDKAQKDNTSKKKLSKNVWIVKPGELSNRGNGITVIDQIYELNTILKSKDKHTNGIEKTYIIQKYIEKPMLYKNRKFDIRHYMMISKLHGRMRAYWFSEGYIRTSSYQYNLDQVGDVMIHLTNDAIQKHGVSYGKYQQGNKLSYAQFQRYLDNTYPEKKYSFIESIYPRMRQIAGDAVKSTYLWMDPDQLEHNFQIFGLDFMIDTNFNVWLIQVNTNPCLQLSSGLLGRIIPTMVENAFRLALDPIFPPTAHYLNTIKYLAPDSPMQRLQFQLIFDQSRDGKQIQELLKKHGKADCGQIQQEDQTYENDGKEIDLGGDLQ